MILNRGKYTTESVFYLHVVCNGLNDLSSLSVVKQISLLRYDEEQLRLIRGVVEESQIDKELEYKKGNIGSISCSPTHIATMNSITTTRGEGERREFVKQLMRDLPLISASSLQADTSISSKYWMKVRTQLIEKMKPTEH